MNCDFITTETPGRYICSRPGCGNTIVSKFGPERCFADCRSGLAPQVGGPGTELMAILKSLGIHEIPGCDCRAKARQMDAWGVSGCRENFNVIVGWMRDGQHHWGWSDKFKAAAAVGASGLAFKIKWTDPFPGLIEEAIRRAEAKHQSPQTADAMPAAIHDSGRQPFNAPSSATQWRFPAIERRNLMFYVLPLRHSLKIWQWHVAQLRKHLDLFNGQRIVTIATPGDNNKLAIEPAELVRQEFGDDAAGIHFIERPNDPEFWEAPAFREMLSLVANENPWEATFYFHAKGVRRADQSGVRPWCEAIYRHNLERYLDAMDALREFPVCGAVKKHAAPLSLPDGTQGGWHFAGTGFWFRHDALFSRPDWQEVMEHSHAVEGYLATKFPAEEAYCLAYEDVEHVYSAAAWGAPAPAAPLRTQPKTPVPTVNVPTISVSPAPMPARVPQRFELAPLRLPPGSNNALRKPWEGSCLPRPWGYRVTAAIPVLDTPEELELAVELLRLQTEKPFIMVIDTGSTPENYARIERLRGSDLEVHSLRFNGRRHPSDFPAVAMDFAFAAAQTELVLGTHADVFFRRRDLIEWLLTLCPNHAPAVGYQITPREHPDWQRMVSHTCTLYHLPSMDQARYVWNFREFCATRGISPTPDPLRANWPDTEVAGNYRLWEAGMEAMLIGKERNWERTLDDNIDHCRTLTAGKLYDAPYYAKASAWAEDAKRQARERIDRWKENRE